MSSGTFYISVSEKLHCWQGDAGADSMRHLLWLIAVSTAAFGLVNVIFSLPRAYPNGLDNKSSARKDTLETSSLAPSILQVLFCVFLNTSDGSYSNSPGDTVHLPATLFLSLHCPPTFQLLRPVIPVFRLYIYVIALKLLIDGDRVPHELSFP